MSKSTIWSGTPPQYVRREPRHFLHEVDIVMGDVVVVSDRAHLRHEEGWVLIVRALCLSQVRLLPLLVAAIPTPSGLGCHSICTHPQRATCSCCHHA